MRIAGYASRFGTRDAGGDVVRRGAFAASLLSRSRPLPMLSDHQRRIGIWTRATEDETGLRVEGEVTDPALARLIRAGTVTGLSIGYRTRRARDGPGSPPGRELLDLDLEEVSVVAFPMLGSARIDRVQDDMHDGETALRRGPQKTPQDLQHAMKRISA
ncbi:MAG: HK97 family phage prohead protease [Pseudomonadota bacterium]